MSLTVHMGEATNSTCTEVATNSTRVPDEVLARAVQRSCNPTTQLTQVPNPFTRENILKIKSKQ